MYPFVNLSIDFSWIWYNDAFINCGINIFSNWSLVFCFILFFIPLYSYHYYCKYWYHHQWLFVFHHYVSADYWCYCVPEYLNHLCYQQVFFVFLRFFYWRSWKSESHFCFSFSFCICFSISGSCIWIMYLINWLMSSWCVFSKTFSNRPFNSSSHLNAIVSDCLFFL